VSKQAVQRLHAMGIEGAMLTGDSRPVLAVAAELQSIDHICGVLPNIKIKGRSLQAHRDVAMWRLSTMRPPRLMLAHPGRHGCGDRSPVDFGEKQSPMWSRSSP
jgi:hypothetical protein